MKIGAAAALALLFILPGTDTGPAAPGSIDPGEEAPDVVVEVRGLSCPFCAYGIEKKFVEREEVDSVFVALEEDEVRLWLEPDRELTDEDVRKTVEEAGFTAGGIRRPEGVEEAWR